MSNGERPGEQWETDAMFAAEGGVVRWHWQADSSAVLPTLPEEVESHRALLGHPGMALERDEVGGWRDDAGVGEKDDLEGSAPHCRVQPAGLSKGGGAEQAGHADGRSTPGASP